MRHTYQAMFGVFLVLILWGAYQDVQVFLRSEIINILPKPPRLGYIITNDAYLNTEWWKVKAVYPDEWHFATNIQFGYDANAYAWVWKDSNIINISNELYFGPESPVHWAPILVHELRHIVQGQWGMGYPSPIKEQDAEIHAAYFKLLQERTHANTH